MVNNTAMVFDGKVESGIGTLIRPDFPQYAEPQREERQAYKSEVYAYEPEDLAKMLSYFRDNGFWIHYLLFVISANSARRVGDLIGYTNKETGKKVDGLHWSDFFDPQTGIMRREIRTFKEQKTGKLASPVINDAMRGAIRIYCEKTGCDPSKDSYSLPVFLQLTGTHKGRVLSYTGALNALKKAAASCDIEYNVGTHSARKTFGATTKMLHPGDASCMEALQSIYNHSSTLTTNRYIGLTRKQSDGYVSDFGKFFQEYAVEGKEIPLSLTSPVISVETEALYDLIHTAFQMGKESGGENEAAAMLALLKKIETIRK